MDQLFDDKSDKNDFTFIHVIPNNSDEYDYQVYPFTFRRVRNIDQNCAARFHQLFEENLCSNAMYF